MKITLTVAPITKKNSQRIAYRNTSKGKIPFVLPSKQYKQYERDCGFFLAKFKENIDYPVNLKATYFMPTRRKVDLINLHSALHDCLVHHGVLADDNCSIVVSTDGSTVQYDKLNPRTEIEITRIEV